VTKKESASNAKSGKIVDLIRKKILATLIAKNSFMDAYSVIDIYQILLCPIKNF
jgi:hypothetical protein